MLNILIKAGCYIAIIILGIFLRRIGFFKESDFSVLSKIVIRVTLPAALIVNAATREFSPDLLVLSLLGLGGGILYMAAGWLVSRHADKEQQAFDILNHAGYNIGVFVIPFTQSFLGATGVMIASIFDVGNAFICLGGAYGVASAVKDGKGFDIRQVLKALAVSVPFLVHIGTVLMNLLHIPFPAPVVECAGIIANANAFLAMLMIGVGFKLSLEKSKLNRIFRALLIRYSIAAALALCYWFLLPFDRLIRLTLVILAVSPIGSAVPGFTGDLGGDVGLSCNITSLTILISIITIVTLLLCLL
jgi:predicted permease